MEVLDMKKNEYYFSTDNVILTQKRILDDMQFHYTEEELKNMMINNDWYTDSKKTIQEHIGNLLEYTVAIPTIKKKNADLAFVFDNLKKEEIVLLGLDFDEPKTEGDKIGYIVQVFGKDKENSSHIEISDPKNVSEKMIISKDELLEKWENADRFTVVTDYFSATPDNGIVG